MAKQTIGLILAALLLTGGVFYAVKRERPPAGLVANDQTTTDWKTYRDEKYGFEFQYPPAYYLSTDLVLDDNTGQGEFHPTVQMLNNGLTKESADGEVWVHVIEHSSLPKTIAEACEEVKTSDPLCRTRSITQEELMKTKEEVGTALLNDKTHTSRVVEVDKEKGIIGLWYSYNWGNYIASFSVFDRNNNRIIIEIPIYSAKDVEDKDGAAKDPYAVTLNRIISTLRF